MVIDAETTTRGHSRGSLKELNLGESIYIGGYPDEYHPDSGVYTGLHGAVQRVGLCIHLWQLTYHGSFIHV